MKRLLAAACIAFGITASLGFAAQVSDEDRIGLQAAMQEHIESKAVNGAYLQLLPGTGEVKPLFAVKAHAMILSMGEFFVLCTDFKDAAGQNVNVDFYMARDGNRFVVFQAVIGERAKLEALMKDGKVAMLD